MNQEPMSTRPRERWEAPTIDEGGAPESEESRTLLEGLRALTSAQTALEDAQRALERASEMFAAADVADIEGLLAASRVALHSAVGRRVAAAVYLLRRLPGTGNESSRVLNRLPSPQSNNLGE